MTASEDRPLTPVEKAKATRARNKAKAAEAVKAAATAENTLEATPPSVPPTGDRVCNPCYIAGCPECNAPTEDAETTVSVSGGIPWKPAGFLSAPHRFEEGDKIMAAIQFYTPEGKESWKFLELIAAQNTVFLTVDGTPFPWKRIVAWVSPESIIPSIDDLLGA